MNMQLSHKDKKLLIYLFSILFLFSAYYFGAMRFIEMNDVNTNKITQLESEIRELTNIYNNSEMYTNKISESRSKIDEAMAKFPPGFAQENTIMMIQDIEDNTGAWISRIAFEEEEILSGKNQESEFVAEDEELDMSESTSAQEGAEEGTGSVSAENIVNVKQSLSMDYYCSYKDFKKLLNYIKNYDKRLYIASISATYSDDSNAVAGNIVLSQYAIYGTGKELVEPDLSSVGKGTDNIFSTLSGTADFSIGELVEDKEELIPASALEENERGEEVSEESEASEEEPQEPQEEDRQPSPGPAKPNGASGGII